MFILTTIEDVVPIEPQEFIKPSFAALQDNVNEKYANKIIPDVGLCLGFHDLLKASDGRIGHGRGTVYVNAEFRLQVFRPFRGEILEGTIQSANAHGMTISLTFFEDIFIPGPQNLFANTRFDPTERVWIWNNDGQDFYFDKNERVRFRVEEEIWTDLAPGDQPPKLARDANAATRDANAGLRDADAAVAPPPPGARTTHVSDEKGEMEGKVHRENLSEEQRKSMRAWRLVGSMQQGGLGCVSWW